MAWAWTPERDAQLLALQAQGLSAAQTAVKMRAPSRNAVISRHHRLRGTKFPYLVLMEEEARRRRDEKQAALRQTEAPPLAELKRQIARGAPRNRAIRVARAKGCRLETIAAVIGVSRERIRQIVSATAPYAGHPKDAPSGAAA
jgi:hypothetical protein